jgi:glycosyltransferase involved in cell wall biosynthesis
MIVHFPGKQRVRVSKLVIQNGARVWGGNEQWLALLARGLLDRRHAVVVSCVAASPVALRLRERGIPVTPVRPRGPLDAWSGWRFRRWLRAERPDALLLTSWRALRWGAWAGRTAPVPRVAVRLGIVRPLPSRGPLADELRRAVDLWIVNAPEIRAAIAASAPDVPLERVRVLLNGVPEPAPSRANLREELGLGAGARVLAAAGHVTARKGFDVALEALALLGDPAAHLVVAGAVAEPEEAARLSARAAALGLGERFHLLGERGDLPAILRGADAFVLTSRNEGMANVLLEAMACGLPVVASDVSGVRTALGGGPGGGAAGVIVPPERPEAVAEALRRILGDRAHASGLGAAARERVRAAFGVDRMVAEAEAMLFG